MRSSRTSGNDRAASHHCHPWPAAGSDPRCVCRMVPPQVVPPVGCPWLGHFVCCGTKTGFHRCRHWRSKILARRLGDQAELRGGRDSNHSRYPEHPALGRRVRYRPADRPLCQAPGGYRTRRTAAVFLRTLLAAGRRAAWHHDHRRYIQPLRLHGDRRAVQLRADRLRQGARLYGLLQLPHHGHRGGLPVFARRRLCFHQARHTQHRQLIGDHSNT